MGVFTTGEFHASMSPVRIALGHESTQTAFVLEDGPIHTVRPEEAIPRVLSELAITAPLSSAARNMNGVNASLPVLRSSGDGLEADCGLNSSTAAITTTTAATLLTRAFFFMVVRAQKFFLAAVH
ncbi:hypothetical protein C0Z10_09185 [Acidipropionibacterium jensenii]|uniref:Uncharacterized protein n=1 Tax=Acidipropionibacterium jensenii TaxID=1749 RepID=A0A3Q9ULI7_9ACTN|nr:hypothetical protein C0Z10_09185 [Acidipropionibacterium jensenii]AZZ41694.1 hypothetical protein C0Z11_04720 [Acidipropionibacterium jensenii]